MRTRWMVVVGAVLPLLLGAALGSSTASEGAGTWAYPMAPPAFLVLSLGLAVSHLLVLSAYAAAARSWSGAGSWAAVLGGAGTAALVVCEVWSGTLATTDLDAPVLDALDGTYAVSSVAVVVGTLVLGAALRRSRSPSALPVLVNGAALLVALPLRFFGGDGVGIAALTVWSLTYVWWGLRLGRTTWGGPVSQVEGAAVAGQGAAGAPAAQRRRSVP